MLKSLQRSQKSSKGKVEAKENVTTEIRANIKKPRISIKKKGVFWASQKLAKPHTSQVQG